MIVACTRGMRRKGQCGRDEMVGAKGQRKGTGIDLTGVQSQPRNVGKTRKKLQSYTDNF